MEQSELTLDILVKIDGRARHLEDVGQVKTPELLRECAAEITRLRADLAEAVPASQIRAEALREGYDAGFANSGEGYNGEYGADVESDYYISTRTKALEELNLKGAQNDPL